MEKSVEQVKRDFSDIVLEPQLQAGLVWGRQCGVWSGSCGCNSAALCWSRGCRQALSGLGGGCRLLPLWSLPGTAAGRPLLGPWPRQCGSGGRTAAAGALLWGMGWQQARASTRASPRGARKTGACSNSLVQKAGSAGLLPLGQKDPHLIATMKCRPCLAGPRALAGGADCQREAPRRPFPSYALLWWAARPWEAQQALPACPCCCRPDQSAWPAPVAAARTATCGGPAAS